MQKRTNLNVLVFNHLHQHREFEERVFSSLGKWEPTRTDRGTVAFPTAVFADGCHPDRISMCQWRVENIEGTGGVCLGVSDLPNEIVADDWAGAGKKDRVWYAILRGGRDAIGALNNGNTCPCMFHSLPPYTSGCVIRLELHGDTLSFFCNEKAAGSLHITHHGGEIAPGAKSAAFCHGTVLLTRSLVLVWLQVALES
jgi:hypothetical protein